MFNSKLWVEVRGLRQDLQGILERIPKLETAVAQPRDLEPIKTQLEHLESRLDTLRAAVSEGIERVDRSERRIRQVVTRARAQLEEEGYRDPGVEAEYAELQRGDGGGGEDGGVQPMSEEVGEPLDLSSVPGAWSQEDIAALRRFRGDA